MTVMIVIEYDMSLHLFCDEFLESSYLRRSLCIHDKMLLYTTRGIQEAIPEPCMMAQLNGKHFLVIWLGDNGF